MFQAQRILLHLTSKKGLSQPLTNAVRFNSSSVGKLNNSPSSSNTSSTTATTTSTTTASSTTGDNNNNQLNNSNENVDLENNPNLRIPFMPVINIPETEFAHHSFFSLHRPLLGLSDEDETPFFSQKQAKSQEEREQEKSKYYTLQRKIDVSSLCTNPTISIFLSFLVDTMLAVYMNGCVPFVEPHQLSSQGEEWKDEFSEAFDNAEKESEKTQVSIKVSEEYQDYQDLFGDDELIDQIEKPVENYNYDNRPLPMFHMPESGDVLDYLTSIESNMKQEHAKLDAEDKLKALRLKKLEILSEISSSQLRKPRFYATHGRNVHQRLRRYQQKWLLK